MNIRRPWVMLALLFVVAAAVGFVIPTTLAYITAQSDTLVNTFYAPYFPPAETSVDVCVRKVVHNTGTESIGPEGFRFQLQNTQNSGIRRITADGSDILRSLHLQSNDKFVFNRIAAFHVLLNDLGDFDNGPVISKVCAVYLLTSSVVQNAATGIYNLIVTLCACQRHHAQQ